MTPDMLSPWILEAWEDEAYYRAERDEYNAWLSAYRSWCIRWPKHCKECEGQGGYGRYSGGSYDSPPEYDRADCPHCIERNRCPRCHGKLRYWKARKSNQIQEGGKCPECGWSYECKDDVAPECPL